MNNLLKFLLFNAILIVNLNSIHAGEPKNQAFGKQMAEAYKALYNFNFHTSKKIIDSLNVKNKKNIDILILNIDYRWWKIKSEDTENNKKKFRISLERLKNNIQHFSEEEKKDVLWIYYYTYHSRYHLRYKNYFKVLNHYPKFDKLIKEFNTNTNEISHQDEIKLIRNFYFYLKYKFLSLNSQKKKHHLNEIKSLTDSEALVVKTESNYLLMRIYTEINNSPEKAKYYQKFLHSRYPNNPLFNTLLSKEN